MLFNCAIIKLKMDNYIHDHSRLILSYSREKINKKIFHRKMHDVFVCTRTIFYHRDRQQDWIDRFIYFNCRFAFACNITNSYDLDKRREQENENFKPREVDHYHQVWMKQVPRRIRNIIHFTTVYLLLKLIVISFLQIIYDRQWVFLKEQVQIDEKKENQRSNHSNLNDYCKYDPDQCHSFHLMQSMMHLVGNCYFELNFHPEVIYIYSMFYYCLNLSSMRFNSYHSHMMDFGLIRMIYGRESEHRYDCEIIRHRINGYIRSSCCYFQINWLKFFKVVYLAGNHNERPVLQLRHSSFLYHIQRAYKLEHSMIDRLKQRAMNNQIHFRMARDLKVMAGNYCWFFVSYSASLIGMFAAMFLLEVLPLMTGPSDRKQPGYLWAFELNFISFTLGQATALYSSICVCTYFEQYVYIDKLIQSTNHCMHQLAIYKLHLNEYGTIEETQYLDTREIVLITLLQYKYFISQFAGFKRGISSQIKILFIPATVLCLWFNLNSEYLDPNLRRILFIMVAVIISVSNTFLLPSCHLTSDCFKLNKQFQNLLAHAIDVFDVHENRQVNFSLSQNKQGRQPNLATLTDDHVIWYMRKELSSFERISTRYIVRCCGIPLTYSTWLKANFLLTIVVSQVLSSSDKQNGVGRLMRIF